MTAKPPPALRAIDVTPEASQSRYPEPFASMMHGRVKRRLGNVFGLTNFGVNLTMLDQGAVSALRHAHSTQDEFVFVLAGNPTLVTNEGEIVLSAGDCAGFGAGSGNAHQLRNDGPGVATFLEIGDRSANDTIEYPDVDLVAVGSGAGGYRFVHKEGTPYAT